MIIFQNDIRKQYQLLLDNFNKRSEGFDYNLTPFCFKVMGTSYNRIFPMSPVFVGKSTFFSAATETPVASGNFPFTTIEPNVGVAYVKADCACKHFGIKHEISLCKSIDISINVKCEIDCFSIKYTK